MESKEKREKRLNIYLTVELREFVESEAAAMGVSMGAMLSFMIATYKNNKQLAEGMGQIVQLVKDQKVSMPGKGIEGTQEGGETD